MNDKIVMRIYRLYIRKIVKDAFDKALAARGKKQQESTEKKFFESLVRIHRAGEGAPFTGLKPTGEATSQGQTNKPSQPVSVWPDSRVVSEIWSSEITKCHGARV